MTETLVLLKNFYDRDAILQAKNDFKDSCEVTIEELDYDHRITFDDGEALLEFQNYILGLMIGRRKSHDPQVYREQEEQKKVLLGNEFVVIPYYVKKLEDHYLLTTRLGGWCKLSKEELLSLRTINSREHTLFQKLYDSQIIVDANNIIPVIKSFRNLNRNLFFGPSLHIIGLTTKCNFDCVYCHAGSPSNENIDMSKEVAVKVIERILDSPMQKILIEFQGGEPLINWEVLKFMVETVFSINKLEQKKIEFGLTSNFTLLTEERMRFLIDHGVKLCTSLDGPKYLHDQNRPFVGGSGSYEKVIKTIRRVQEEYQKRGRDEILTALVTLTRQNLPHIKEIIDEYATLDFPIIHLRYLEYGGETLKTWDHIGYTVEKFMQHWKEGMDHIIELNKKGILMMERGSMVILQKLLRKEDPAYTELMNPCGQGRCQIAYKENGDVVTTDNARSIEGDLFTLGNVLTDSYNEIMSSPVLLNAIQSSLIDIFRPFDPYNAWNGICPVENFNMQGNVVAKLCGSFRFEIHKQQISYLFEHLEDPQTKEIFIKWLKRGM